MAKVLHCKNVGFDCEGIVRADTAEEVLQMAAAHAQAVHGLQEITPEIVEQVKAAMRDE